jgi:dihydrofolate synthase/folylpolyglutamate synthase
VTIRNLRQAETALLPYVPLVKQLTGKDTTLDRIRPLMKLLGNPQDKLRMIHIAGTSGKTSTAYYLAALLEAAGKKTGLTVSPHVDSITERVQMDGRPLAVANFCGELGSFLDIVRQLNEPPSYFELLYAFAIWVFERQGVEYAVIETGMGGLHDATNVAARADKVCIITDIGFDHTYLLGRTLPEIAAQKVGIVHDRNHLFMYQQADEVMTVVRQWARQYQAPLQVITEATEEQTYSDDLGVMPNYQRRNWLLAHRVYNYLRDRDGLQSLTRQALRTTQLVQVPARMDIKQVSNKILVMDGAHNAQKMTAFVDSFRQLYPGIKPAILLALKDGKDYQELIPILASLAGSIITTTFKTSQDLPVVSMNSKVLARALRAGGAIRIESVVDQKAAFRVLMAATEEVCIITGSFYLLSQIRNNEHLT